MIRYLHKSNTLCLERKNKNYWGKRMLSLVEDRELEKTPIRIIYKDLKSLKVSPLALKELRKYLLLELDVRLEYLLLRKMLMI